MQKKVIVLPAVVPPGLWRGGILLGVYLLFYTIFSFLYPSSTILAFSQPDGAWAGMLAYFIKAQHFQVAFWGPYW